MLDYLRSFIERDSKMLTAIEESSVLRDDIQPSIEPELGKFLGLLVRLTRAKKILEIGSGIGYSALWLGEALKTTGGKLLTIDNHTRTHREVLATIKTAGLSHVVESILGDAETIVPSLEGEWDLIFQDGGKYLYPLLYEALFARLKIGGVLVADDTLFKVNPEVRKGLGLYTDAYNKKVFSDTRLYSVLLPVGHGVTVSFKVAGGVDECS